MTGTTHHCTQEAAPRRPTTDGRKTGWKEALLVRVAAFLLPFSWWATPARGSETPPERVEATCLAVSPLRAIPALEGRKDTLGPEGWRDAVVRTLRQQRTDSNWIFRAAGECPDGVATIDVFQLPTDVVARAQGQALRVRMEWRHVPGTAEFFLAVSEKRPLEPSSVAEQMLAFADQQMAQVELSSLPPGASAKVLSGETWRTLGPAPRSILVPPGALSVAFETQAKQRRIDTLVDAGGSYTVVADFRAARIDPRVHWTAPPTWPLWSMAVISVAGGIWATREQILAQRAYSRLGANDTPAAFSDRWSRLRTANLWRNGLLSAAVVFGVGAGWMEWNNGRDR